MLSLKKFLSAPDPDATRLRVIIALLEAISQHSPVADPVEHNFFQADIQRMINELAPETNSAELLLMAGRAAKTFEDYYSRTTARMVQQSKELSSIVEMLTQTVTAITAAHGRSGAHLVAMQKDLKAASDIDDVRVLRIRISECLKEIQIEAREQEKETAVTLAALRRQGQAAKTFCSEKQAFNPDPVTGLPDRAAAEKALSDACHSPVQIYAALYVLENIVLINRRFGISIGDQALREFSRLLRANPHPGDRFFRWSGPAFLALVQREEPIEKVRDVLTSVIPKTCEVTVETDSRSLMLPLYWRSAVFPMSGAPSVLIGELVSFTLGSQI